MTKSLKSDENLFRGASIKKTWLDKRIEAKAQKEKQEREAKAAADSNSSGFFSSIHSNQLQEKPTQPQPAGLSHFAHKTSEK